MMAASASPDVELECGDISASQEDLLARSAFLGGGGEEEEEEAEVLSTPPLTHSQGGQGEEGEDAITMCTLPFTPQSPSPPSSLEEETKTKPPRKPLVCTTKVRGSRISSVHQDPLCRAVLMIPTAPAPCTATGDLLALARQRGLFS